jgi:hypothetical protein
MRFYRKIAASMLMIASVATVALGSSVAGSPGKSEPQGLRWRNSVVRLSISTSIVQPSPNIKTDSDVIGAIRRSIDVWERAANIRFEISFTDRGAISPAGAAGDGISLITIAQTPENVLLFSRDPQAESAKTRVFFSKRNYITEADIVLNPFQQFSTDGTFGTFDLEATLTHEIGHLLGLRHSAVLGATMAGSLPKVGTFGTLDIVGRGLSASDIASIRDLYGLREELESCCSTIAGKLVSSAAKSAKGITIWAEDSKTGSVAGVVETASDGSFRLGGLPAGAYSVFWQRQDELPTSIGTLGTFNLAVDETRLVAHKIVPERADLALAYVGVNGRLSDSAISLSKGREYTILLGGNNLDPANFAVEFNSPYLTVRPNSMLEQDFGTGVSVVSVVVMVHEDTPPGVYSIFATTRDSAMSSLVGAINIQ